MFPFTDLTLPPLLKYVWGIQHHVRKRDEFSTYLYSIPMKTKSKSDIITVFTTLIAYFKQFGYDIHTLHSDHESSLMSAMVFLNQQGIKYLTIAPYQHEQKVERYVQTINSRFRSVLSSMKL